MTTVDLLISEFQTRGVSGMLRDFKALGFGADDAEPKISRLGKVGSAFTLMGAGTTAAAAGINRITRETNDAYRSAEDMETKLKEMLRVRGEPQAFADLEKFDKNYGFKVGMNTEDLEDANVRLLSFGLTTQKIKDLLPGMVGQSLTETKALGQVAEELGKNLEKANLNPLSKAGITFDPSTLKAFDVFKQTHTDAENAAEAIRLVESSLAHYTVDATKGIGGAKLAQAQYNEELRRTEAMFGKGSIQAQNALYKEGAKFLAMLDKHPAFIEDLGKVAGVVAPIAAGAGPIMLLAGAYLKMKDSRNLATLAADKLKTSTLADDAAERAKTATAGLESKAIRGTGSAAFEAAQAKKALAEETRELPQLEEAATEAAGGRMAGFRALMSKPFQMGGMTVPNVNAFGQGGGTLTEGGALASAGLGLGAFSLTQGDSRAIGLSEGQSEAYASVTGIATGVTSAIFPPARLMFAAAEGLGLAVDKLHNEPMERAAAMGSGAENTDIYGEGMQAKLMQASKSKDREAQAKVYDEMSRKAGDSGDDTMKQSYALQAASERAIGVKERTPGTAEYIAAQQAAMPVSSSNMPTVQQGILGVNSAVNPYHPNYGAQTLPQIQGNARVQNGRTVLSFADIVLPDPHGAIVQEAQRRMDAQIRNVYR